MELPWMKGKPFVGLEINKVYCGDCLELMKKIPDKAIDLILTDPPYGLGENNKSNLARCHSTKAWHRSHAIDYGEFDWDFSVPDGVYFQEIFRVSKNQIIFGGNYFNLPPSPCWIVWDKKTSGDFADCELAWTSFKTAVRKFTWLWSGYKQESGNKERRVHPTQKPLPLMEWCLENYSKFGDLVLDPFMGSGTTCVACRKMDRNFIGIDRERKYVDIADERIRSAPIFSLSVKEMFGDF